MTDQSEGATDRDKIPRCFRCRYSIDPRAENAIVHLNPYGGKDVGFHAGHLCEECEQEFAEKMRRTIGGNV